MEKLNLPDWVVLAIASALIIGGFFIPRWYYKRKIRQIRRPSRENPPAESHEFTLADVIAELRFLREDIRDIRSEFVSLRLFILQVALLMLGFILLFFRLLS